ncbi:hypothetical protein NAEGRDRAFT_78089 [Naegleria gruberi]|uniref:Uncharacterized protein n=1 Tax=Naegleria gruberi TaxID=5762 RepID=D2V0Z0_NAEGR|nr:uncharacterized protein NAEGRDRAFT_78089 [Naegleria gruberi]EFC49810.1 hypothetical protein NAEGRDRAFT_78089 [Naegleria gruberi]|eukprot:XP_002682554.1 hypothetical protein NAEGRDRAFT_78089 [Naegleria gruberi strain NEG-M]
MSVIPTSDNNNLLPPDLSITVSTPEESNRQPKITLEIPKPIIEPPTETEDPYNLSEFKMGTKSPKKAPVANVPDFTNYQLGQKPPKQKKVGFMGPLVDIIVHGGLGLPNNHKIRRHSYTPQPSADLLEKSNVSPPLRKPNANLPQPTIGLVPSPKEKRDLSKSVADFVLPQPVDIEPSPKLFVATISKTRRMSLKDETAERLNDLLSKQRTDQYKL